MHKAMTRSFDPLDTVTVYVLRSDATLWLNRGPFGTPTQKRKQVDGNVAGCSAVDPATVYVLGIDGNLWLEHGPFGTVPPKRDPVDNRVVGFSAVDAATVYVIDRDENLWLDRPPFGSGPPTRERVDANVTACVAVDAATVYVLDTEGNLWLEHGPFGGVPPQRDHAGINVVAVSQINAGAVYMLQGAGSLWLDLGPFASVSDKRAPVDLDVNAASAIDAVTVYVLGSDGKLWLEHGPFGQTVPPPRDPVDSNVMTAATPAGSTLMWFDTVVGAAGLGSTPGSANQHTAATVFGYRRPGDGGGGEFYWDPYSTLAPDQGTVFTVPDQPTPVDPQTLLPGRWLRLYDGSLNVRWFGAYGDGVHDDTGPIKRALDAACRLYDGLLPTTSMQTLLREPGSATVYFPPGTYAVSATDPQSPALTLAPGHSGITLKGAAPGGSATRSPSVIRLTGEAKSLLQISTTVLRVEDLWLDGNLLAHATVQFISLGNNPGQNLPLPPDIGSVCSDILFLRVFITGAWWSGTPGTYDPRTQKVSGKTVLERGNLVHFAGQREFTDYADSEIDNVLFTRCQIRQYWPDPVVGLPSGTPSPDGEGAAGVVINNDNGQAFMINFEHCWVANGETVVQVIAGACHFRHCVVFFGSYAIFSLEAVQLMIIEDCYIEQSSVPFVKMENASGNSGAPPIIVRNCQINTASSLVLDCKQPVILEGNVLGGNVIIQPAFEANNAPPSAGWFPVVAVGNSFSSPNTGFVAPPGLLVEVANRITPGASALFTNRIVSPVETYTDSALANYDMDGLSLAVADGAIAPTAGTVITGDSHWITGLTADRMYALSVAGANLGSRMRISRVAAGDSNAVTIHNQSGTPLVTLGGTTGLGWADFLYVANNGWVLVAKGPA